jgi:lambda family phage portal protein
MPSLMQRIGSAVANRSREFAATLWQPSESGDRDDHFPAVYKGASLDSQETFAWRPPLTSAESATLYDRVWANSRADDLARNDPHAVAAITRLTDMIVGAGIRLAPRPNARALGLDPSKPGDRKILKEFSAKLKSEWELFARDPRFFNDAQRRYGLNTQLRLMCKTWRRRGETTAYLTWKNSPGARYATCLRVIDPDRLCNPMGQADTLWMRGGISYDDDGVPIAYHVRNGHPSDWFRYAQLLKWTTVPRTTPWGRPVFIHAMEPDREDQSRSITPFAALMTRLRMISKFADAELANATVNALFAAFVHSNLPIAEASQAFTPQATTFADKRHDYWRRNPARVNGVRIPVLPIGDEIKINSASRPTGSFPHFQTAFLQSIAASMGISYEQLSMDWSKTNYSSARAALNEVWRHIEAQFSVFIEQVMVPIYYAFAEEAFDRGYLAPVNGIEFEDMPGAYLGARWIGPGRGYVDPVKEAQAAGIRMDQLTSTLEDECAEMGNDWEDVLDQAFDEKEELAARGLKRAVSGPGNFVADSDDEDDVAADAGKTDGDKAAEKASMDFVIAGLDARLRAVEAAGSARP